MSSKKETLWDSSIIPFFFSNQIYLYLACITCSFKPLPLWWSHSLRQWPACFPDSPPTEFMTGFIDVSEGGNTCHLISKLILIMAPDEFLITVKPSQVCVIEEATCRAPCAAPSQQVTGRTLHFIYGHVTGICNLPLGKGDKLGVLSV